MMHDERARRPAVAGQFYPSDPEELRETVERHLESAGVTPAPEQVAAVIAPHAGYIFSGPTAGFAFARVRGKRPKRVVLLGCSHRHVIDTASVYPDGVFETPLGDFPIDRAFAQEFVATAGAHASTEPHLHEHALEVELPFISVAIGQVPIVPILFGGRPGAWHAKAGEALAGLVDDDDLVVASTDLSHYLTEDEANALDRHSLDTVLGQDWRKFADSIVSGACSTCGATAVAAAMTYALARNASDWRLLNYSTSARTSGDYDRVVGYAAISMERPA